MQRPPGPVSISSEMTLPTKARRFFRFSNGQVPYPGSMSCTLAIGA
jgi:hypothetical protein